MNVLFVDQTGQLGGGELSLFDVIHGSSHTAEVALFSDGPFRKLLEEIHVPVHLLSAGSAVSVRREAGLWGLLSVGPSLLRLRNQLSDLARSFDVIYANSQKAFLISALAKSRNQLLVWHLRDMLNAQHFSSLMRRIAVFAGNRFADLIIANSEATLESLVASGGRRDKAIVIYNGISKCPFDAVSEASVSARRKELGLEGKFVVGSFGRLSPWKGQHMLIEALAELPTVYALIVGDALFGEKEYAESLRDRVRALGMDDRVTFLGFRSDIPLLMRAVDVVAHTATAPEPFGRVIVEGMLARRPVIATRAGGALEILRDNDTGCLIKPGDVEELRNAITRLQKDLVWSVVLADRGYQNAATQFSLEAMVASIDDALYKGKTRTA